MWPNARRCKITNAVSLDDIESAACLSGVRTQPKPGCLTQKLGFLCHRIGLNCLYGITVRVCMLDLCNNDRFRTNEQLDLTAIV